MTKGDPRRIDHSKSSSTAIYLFSRRVKVDVELERNGYSEITNKIKVDAINRVKSILNS
jgi:hypothetical protein